MIIGAAHTETIKAQAHALGFDLVGVAEYAPPPHAEALDSWLNAGYAGDLAYLSRNAAARADPRLVMPEGRSILVVGKHYRSAEPLDWVWRDPSRGRISRYAWGADYHDILLPRLRELVSFIETLLGRPVLARPYVDTGPVLERPVAAAAGLGFIGKNTLLINPRQGSWLFLAEVLLDVELEPSLEPARGGCGTCTRCQTACPTRAFVGPYVLDARRCISYLTIELKSPIPRELRPLMGNRIFGCDDCQEVCPWNVRFGATGDAEIFHPDPDRIAPRLLNLIALDDEAFRARFKGSPIKRAKRRGLLRNVAVALGNWGDPQAVPALSRALSDPEPLIRGHVAWALGRIGDAAARAALRSRYPQEDDPWVREELEASIA
ncbi:MAG: epoxyqueuosine reductase [Herpetosiphonaceae bacterium]|nr:MAG: epoxyqueuosine reductase [Herpetosiphonaceae bacterium]